MVACGILLIAFQIGITETVWTQETEGYSIEVTYPEIALENEAVGNRLEEYALEQVKEFQEMYQEYFMDDPFLPEWDMNLNFTHEPSPEGMICIIAWHWAYTGGAHGNTMTNAILYDLEDETFITTTELLGGEEKLEQFAAAVISELLSEDYYVEDWVERGASPDPANYHTVLPVPDENGVTEGYLVLFPPYQVDCYASGTVEVYIPVE